MQTPKTALVVDDDPTIFLILKKFLIQDGFEVDIVETGYEALEIMREKSPDVVLLDLGLPDIDGLNLIQDIHQISNRTEVIVITGKNSIQMALDAIKKGARDYLVKPIDRHRLSISIQNAVDRIELSRKLVENDENVDISQSDYGGLIGQSGIMRDLYKALENLSKCDEPVFIAGEHGVGKSHCARVVHDMSMRKGAEFVRLNCLSMAHEFSREAFQKAVEKARGGTLYLSYATDLCDEGQLALFELLEANENIRLICSSSSASDIETKNFRQDLYYRLKVMPLEIAPLRARSDDACLLAEHFLRKSSEKQGKNFKVFDELTLQSFKDYHWPGNVRELENVIQSIVSMNSEGEIITSLMLPKELTSTSAFAANENDESAETPSKNVFEDKDIISIPDLERMAIEHALELCKGNVQKAALQLKISPATLYRKKPNIEKVQQALSAD